MPANQLTAHDEDYLLAEDERWLTVQHVVESPYFKKSPRLRTLLLYLAEQTLAARTDLLSEHNIATAVFERKADFDPDVDTIVRSHMVRLRQKLDQYAVENEANGSICVTVPKGEYRVRFDHARPGPPQAAVPVLPVSTPQNVSSLLERRNPLLWACGILSFICLVLLAALVAVLVQSRTKAQVNPVSEHPLWSRFFQPHQTTTLIAADSGLVLLHRMTGKSTTLQEYLTRDFSHETRGLSAERTDEVLNIDRKSVV